MNSILAEILKTSTVKTADGSATRPVHSGVSLSDGRFLQQLVRQADPVVSLEVGLAFGISALFICDALSERARQHIVIDPHQYKGPWGSWEGIGMENLRRAGHAHRIRFIGEPSYRAMADLERAGQKIDFAFIDGHHAFDFALVDFFLIDLMLNPGGIVVFDDADWPAVRKVCRFVLTNRAYTVISGPPLVRNTSLRRRIVERAARIKSLRRYARSEIVEPDLALGLSGSCVAFQKDADDTRLWDHFADF
jgi:predicted O-methyltransferase YrrM